MLISYNGDYHWQNTPTLVYKEDSSPFKDITRQILVDGVPGLPCQLRYFEVAPGGYSTLEHHQHVHLVVIFRGEGDVLLENKVHHVQEKDVLVIPALAWHQLRATSDTPLGFLCLVNSERDKPLLPTPQELSMLKLNPDIAEFIR
jgi:quercetin dioxygenase-like cupin family protein